MMPTVVGLGRDGDARGARSESHHIALVSRPARSARATEIQGLEKICLPRSVRPSHNRQSRAERDANLVVSAEIA